MVSLPIFRNAALLETALTHRSYANESASTQEHNERLEFLGDAVLNFLCGEFLYQQYPDKPEGELSSLRAALVDEAQFANFAIALDLGRRLRLGKGAELEGGRQNPNLLSSAFEALIGAYFLDSGSDIPVVRQYVLPFFRSAVETLTVTAAVVNYKSQLQEVALRHWGEIPRYAIVRESGPDHAREFTAIVQIAGISYGTGSGRRKQDAEKAAAKDALEHLNNVNTDADS